MSHPISKLPTRHLSCSLYPGYKNGLKTLVQRQFSLELAHCSKSISHSNKIYSPLILPHVWKFFSNPHLVHDIFDGPCGNLGSPLPPPHFSIHIGTLCELASAMEATEELWPGLPSGVFQSPHCSLCPSSCHPNG